MKLRRPGRACRARGSRCSRSIPVDRVEQQLPALEEERVEDLLLGVEVVVDEAVGDARLSATSETRQEWNPWRAKTRDRGVEDHPALVDAGASARGAGHQVVPHRLRDSDTRRSTRLARLGQPPTDLGLAVEIEIGGDEALLVGRAREDLAPRVDDHRAAEALLLGGVMADLVGGQDEDLVLDRAGAQQDLPVGRAGRPRERSRHGDHPGAARARGSGRARGSAGRNRWSGRARCRRRSVRGRPRRPAPRPPTRGTPPPRPRRRTCGSCGRRPPAPVRAEVNGACWTAARGRRATR